MFTCLDRRCAAVAGLTDSVRTQRAFLVRSRRRGSGGVGRPRATRRRRTSRVACNSPIIIIIIIERTHIFQPVAVENLGTMNASAYGFLAGLWQKISAISGDDRETCYLVQRISVLIRRFNATLLHESFADENRSDD